MTVSSTLSKITYQGNASATSFSFPFSCAEASDIQVYYTDPSGNETLISPTLYTVTLNPLEEPNVTPTGGLVFYAPNGSPIPNGSLLTILRTMEYIQQVSLPNQGTLLQSVIEGEFDKLLMQIQQNAELLGRTIQVAASDDNPPPLPPAQQRKNLVLGFDNDGNPVPVSTVPSGMISSAMQPVCAAPTIAAAQALLGITAVTGVVPVGAELDYAGIIAPQYFFMELGQAVNRTDYPELLAILSPIYNATINSGNPLIVMPARADGLQPTTGLAVGMKVEAAGIIPAGATIQSLTTTQITLSAAPTANGSTLRIFPHGNGDGSGTFNIPDCRGQVSAGLDPQNATSRLTKSTAQGVDASGVGGAGGEQAHTTIVGEMPVHNHDPLTAADAGHTHPYHDLVTGTAGTGTAVTVVTGYAATNGQVSGSGNAALSASSSNKGGGGAHNNVQPTAIRMKIIYAGRATI